MKTTIAGICTAKRRRRRAGSHPPFGVVHPHLSQCLYHDSEPITRIHLSETEIDQKDEGNDKMLRKARENRQYPNPSLMRRRRQTIKHLIYN